MTTRDEVESELWQVLSRYSRAPRVSHVGLIMAAVDSYAASEAARLLAEIAAKRPVVHLKTGLARIACREAGRHASVPMTRELTAVTCGACTRTTAYRQAGEVPQ